MNFLNKFKSKKFVKILTAIGVCTVATVCSLSVMLSSWFSYKDYYDKTIAEKEYQKYLDSLPLEFLGIEATVSDLVLYCNNGKASPKEEDFIVMANFTEKGKEFSKRLAANTYTISYPDNFAARGGDIVISYSYQPEKPEDAAEDDPMPDPITKTTTVNITLESVKVSSIELVKKPNRVYYCEGASFNADGMELIAHYNDGRKSNITGKDVDFNADVLTVDTESVAITYGEASLDIPVTVVEESDYVEGNVVDIAIEGEVFVKENATVDNTLNVSVRGTYESGNRLLLSPDKYSLGGRGTPKFGKSYYVTASLVGAADVSSTYRAYVQKSYEAESATLNGASVTTVESFIYADGDYSSVGDVVATRVVSGNSVTFTIAAEEAMKTQFNVCLSNQGESVALNKIATMRVNGKKVGISASAVMNGLTDKTKPVFVDYMLSNLCLNKGENTVSFTFENVPAASTILFVKIGLVMGSKGEAEVHTGKYMVQCASEGKTPTLTTEKVFDWHNEFGKESFFTRGICTDGSYIYGVCVGFAGSARMAFARYDVATGEIVTSKIFAMPSGGYVTEASAGITYYDGKLIVYQENGGMKCIPANFTSTTEISDYAGFDAFKKDGETITNVYYNSVKQLFAVRSSGGKLRIYDKNMLLVAENNKSSSGVRMTGDDEYIYLSNNSNKPYVEVIDWTGKSVGTFTIPNSPEIVGLESISQTNTQGIAFMGGDLYYTSIRWSGVSDTIIIKMSAATAFNEELDVIDYTTGETLSASTVTDDNLSVGKWLVENGATNVTTSQVIPFGEVTTSTLGFVRGMCTDGLNLYMLCTNYDSVDGAQVVRYNIATGAKVCSKFLYAGNVSDGVKEASAGITYLNGKLIVYSANGTANCIDAKFTERTEFEPYTGFETFKKNDTEMITDVYYNVKTQKYVVSVCTIGASEWAGKTVRIFDNNMNQLKEFASPVGNINARMSADENYIYFNNRGLSPYITAYDWNGTKVGTFTLANSAEAMGVASTGSMNTQGILSLNDSFYFATICWSGGTNSTIMKVSRNDITIPKTPSAVETESNFINVWDGNLGDACTDGEYLYTSVISETGVSIYKIDAETMAIEAKSGEIVCENATAMLYVKDAEICAIVGGKTYAITIRNFENGCTLTEKTTGVLANNVISTASGVTYNADADRYVVASQSQGKIFIVKADGSSIEKEIDVSEAFNKISGQFTYWANNNEVKMTSITCDEKYVYVSVSCKGQEVLPVMLFNWDGDAIGATQYVSGITMPAANGNYDVGGLLIYQDKLLVISRSLGQGGGYVWEIKA